jgi:hypothetical protein
MGVGEKRNPYDSLLILYLFLSTDMEVEGLQYAEENDQIFKLIFLPFSVKHHMHPLS